MQDLVLMYLRYAESKGFKSEVLGRTESSVSLKLDGPDVWELFRSESGKHIVQRVPPTESKGRRHTSVVSVAVMLFPEEVDCDEEIKDVEITTQKGHGKGGQHQNTTDSAVRAVHRPSGISVFINGRKQKENKRIAMAVISQRIFDWKNQEAQEKINKDRKGQLGGGSRSGKVRTYSFIDGFVTNHITGNRTTKIKQIMKGELDLIQ